jgi:hypothetical protein
MHWTKKLNWKTIDLSFSEAFHPFSVVFCYRPATGAAEADSLLKRALVLTKVNGSPPNWRQDAN